MSEYTGRVLIDLMDPEVFMRENSAEYADLFVSWDGLALACQDLGPLYSLCRGCTWTGLYSETRASHLEYEMWRTVRDCLHPDVVAASAREVRRVLLTPVLDALRAQRDLMRGGEVIWHPVDARCMGDGRYLWGNGVTARSANAEDWRKWLDAALGLEECMRSGGTPQPGVPTVVHALWGLWGLSDAVEPAGKHWIPVFKTTTWGELLEQIRWIICMAWLSTLQGEWG